MNALYSSFIVDALEDERYPHWVLFEATRSIPVAGSPKTVSSAAHTNIPRPGSSGLPMYWLGTIHQWRAATNLRLDERLLDWAAETTVKLSYNQNTTFAPLLDLLMAPQPLNEYVENSTQRGARRPLMLREQISYEAQIDCSEAALDHLKRYLVEQTIGHRMIMWLRLEGFITKGAR